MILERTSMNEYSQLRAATVLQGKHYCLMTDEGLVVHMLIEKKYPLKKEILGNQLTLLLGEELASPRSNSSGKENGLQILQSIDQGPFELGTTRDTLETTPEGDVRATNIVLQGLPKDIYNLINHNIKAKAIWDNIKMLLAGSKLTKEDRESQLYDEFERFKMIPGENINEYYGNEGSLNRAGNANAGQGKPIKCYNCNGLRHNARNCTHRSVHKNSAYFKDKKPVDMNVTFDSDVEMMNRLSQTYSRPNFSTSQGQQIRKLGPSNASIYLKVYDQKTKTALGAQNPCYLRQAKKAQPALYDGDELLKPHHVPVIVPSSEEELELAEATRNKLHVKMNDSAMWWQRSKLKEKISRLTKKNSDADPIFDLKALVSQNKDLTVKLNALHDLNERFRAENAKVKQHYKELYDSIKITRAKTTDQNNSLLSEIENLKAQLKDNSKCVTIPDSKPKVLSPGRYPIDVEPIPPRHKNNREVHLHYIKHLKEIVETLREIVEDVKVERPLDTSLASAFRYTKHSQELLEYVIGTCPKDFSPRDKQNASTTLLRKKRVMFVELCETSTHNTLAQVEHQKINLTNAPRIPSTGVKGASAACRSKPRSNTKKDRTLPTKSALKQVEAHSRINKSNEKQKNHVDSSISYKRNVINSNSHTSCKTCNKCLISINHDQCVVRSEMFGKQSPTTKWRPTGRLLPLGDQWPLTRNTLPTVLPTKQWKPTGRLLSLGRQCPLVRSTALKSDFMPTDP
ncbi:hypothetical protein Tco_0059785 [Tanacetum coccineum]